MKHIQLIKTVGSSVKSKAGTVTDITEPLIFNLVKWIKDRAGERTFSKSVCASVLPCCV